MALATLPVPGQMEVAKAIESYNSEIDQLKAQLESCQRSLIQLLFKEIEQHDPARAAHCLRVSQYAQEMAHELGLEGDELENVELAGLFHDYGALEAPFEILVKQDGLDEDERSELREYVLDGARLLASIRGYDQIVHIIENRYEAFNGVEGYPGRRSGQLIPLGARIIAVANAYDALVNRRQNPLSQSQALAEIEREAGQHYDPAVVAAFRRVIG